MMPAEPQKEHAWLDQLVGEWTYEHEADMGPDQPKSRFTGRERVRSLGGLWIVGEGEGDMPGGGTARTMLTLGYDPQKGRYVGSWIGSMMTLMWIYSGSLDGSGRILTLDCEGPSFTDPERTAPYQDIIEIVEDGHRLLRSRTKGEDGTWKEFLVAHYRRTG